MESYREIYDKGIDYYYNTVSLEKRNRFGEDVTVTVAIISAEYLLTSVLAKKNIKLYGHGLGEIIKALIFNRIIPPHIRDKAKVLDLGCGCNGAKATADEVKELVVALREVKIWVDTKIKAEVPA